MKKYIVLIMVILLSLFLIGGCAVKDEIKQPDDVKEELENDIQEDNGKEAVDEEQPEEEKNGDIKEGVLPGNRAYDFTLPDREGNEISLSDFRGKVVFLNFWASWCPPCKDEMPDMEEFYNKYKDKDVVVLAVNITKAEKNGAKDTNKFLDEKGYTFPVLLDIEGEVSNKYYISNIPTTYIIDEEGIIVNFIVGQMNKEMMIKQIESVRE